MGNILINSKIKEKIITQASISFGIPILLFVLLFFLGVFTDLLDIISGNNFLLSLVICLSVLSFLLLFYSILGFRSLLRLYVVIDNDITEIKQLKSDVSYIFDTFSAMIYITDSNYKVNWANKSLLLFDKEVLGRSISDIFNYNNETQELLSNCVLISGSVEKNVVYYPSNTLFASETYMEHIAIPIKSGNKISNIIVISENITGRVQLNDSKQRLSLMVTASKDAIFVVDLNKHITSWNKGAEDIFGYKEYEIIGQPVMILDHLIDFTTLSFIFDLEKIIETRSINNIESVEIRGLSFLRVVDFTVYPFFNDVGAIVGISAIVRDRTDMVLAKKALELSEMQMRNLALHLDTTREEERKEIAFIVHDELGYALSAIKMDISWLQRNIGRTGSENISERMNDMLKLVDVTIQNVKTLSSNLRPSILDHFGLIAAIEEQSGEFQRRTGIRCKVNVESAEDINIPDNIRTPIFRIFQEAQTNITRYAKASRVDINISYFNDLFVLEIVDNGIGIPNEKINAISSFGLLGIREKAKSIGGEIFITSKKNEGTIIRLELKIKLAI